MPCGVANSIATSSPACFGQLTRQQQGVLCIPEVLLGTPWDTFITKAADGDGARLNIIYKQLLDLLLAAGCLSGQHAHLHGQTQPLET